MPKSTRDLTHAALLAALYAALSHLQNILLPGSASWIIQFRVAEALCVLAIYTPAALWGVSVGCLLFNLTAPGLPLDFLIGTAATALSLGVMRLTRRLRIRGFPWVAMAMPAIFNGLLVGWELSVCIGGAFWLNGLYVALGETAVMLTLGTLLHRTLKLRGLSSRLFG